MTLRKLSDMQELEMATAYTRGSSFPVLCARYAVSSTVVRGALKRHGVVSRRGGPPQLHLGSQQLQVATEMYLSGISQITIARTVGCSQPVVGRALREAGVPSRGRVPRGAAHGKWKGGRTVTSAGYVLVRPDVGNAIGHSMRNRMGYVPEHRLVMAQKIGRPLLRSETVHHIDGNRANNTPDNLELRIGNHGKGATGKHCETCRCFPVQSGSTPPTED